MRETFLRYTVLSLLLFGMVAAAAPFILSLRPNAKAFAALPRVKLPELGPNSYAFLKDPLSISRWPTEILVVRLADGNLNSWVIPTERGRYRLAEYHWYYPFGYLCADLSPDFQTETIHCKDEDAPEWVRQDYRWSLDGLTVSSSSYIPDLQPFPGVEILGDIVFMHPDAR